MLCTKPGIFCTPVPGNIQTLWHASLLQHLLTSPSSRPQGWGACWWRRCPRRRGKPRGRQLPRCTSSLKTPVEFHKKYQQVDVKKYQRGKPPPTNSAVFLTLFKQPLTPHPPNLFWTCRGANFLTDLTFGQFDPKFGTFLPLKSIFMPNLCCQKAFRIIQNLQQNFWTWVWSLLGPMCVGKVWDPVQNQLFSLPLCQYGEVIQWCELIKGNDEMPWMPGAVLFIYRYFLDRVPRHMGGGGYSPRLDKYYHFCILFS